MGRPNRYIRANTIYNVYSQCCGQEPLMASAEIKKMFLTTLKQSHAKMDFQLISYSILDDHFHIIIKTNCGGESISNIMKDIKFRFSRKYNIIFKRKGAFWSGRYEYEVIENSKKSHQHLLKLIWYTAYNTCRAGKIQNPRMDEYGCINIYLDKNFSGGLDISFHEAFLNLGNSFAERRKEFLSIEQKNIVFLLNTKRTS